MNDTLLCIILALKSHASCLQCYLGSYPGSPEATTFLLNECNEKNCWIHGMQAVWCDRRYRPGVKLITWIQVPSKKADGLTERQMKINGHDNLHICDQETDLTADWPRPTSRSTKSQLLHFSFAFCFHLWGEKAGLPLILKCVALCDLPTASSLDLVLSKQTPKVQKSPN